MLLFVLLAIVMSVPLRFTDFDYSFLLTDEITTFCIEHYHMKIGVLETGDERRCLGIEMFEKTGTFGHKTHNGYNTMKIKHRKLPYKKKILDINMCWRECSF
jgi:hypothetical protein